jgi:hypothetical protein
MRTSLLLLLSLVGATQADQSVCNALDIDGDGTPGTFRENRFVHKITQMCADCLAGRPAPGFDCRSCITTAKHDQCSNDCWEGNALWSRTGSQVACGGGAPCGADQTCGASSCSEEVTVECGEYNSDGTLMGGTP